MVGDTLKERRDYPPSSSTEPSQSYGLRSESGLVVPVEGLGRSPRVTVTWDVVVRAIHWVNFLRLKSYPGAHHRTSDKRTGLRLHLLTTNVVRDGLLGWLRVRQNAEIPTSPPCHKRPAAWRMRPDGGPIALGVKGVRGARDA